ncbi:uncharacterized protein LOC123675267 [Harmonia axyridis]|uniref:uncharacterized protein LOC123675267 n=1 Tax=Harmonia axyridis TaxID=115357 RepID=UPI001E277522|nr:uncharacterized protein LOC123675267 [Harmonia axyridis]
MLKSVINIREDIDISKFPKLLAFLKRRNEGFKPKKSRILTSEQVDQFLREAPDDKYLMLKVALILGVAGACRGKELVNLEIDDVRDLGDSFLIAIRNTKNKIDRNFVIKNSENSAISFVAIFRKYVALRKTGTPHSKFFVQYINKECTTRVVGKNMFGTFPRQIAAFLKLENATSYTGHCFRRTSASLLADSGATIDVLKRHGGWKSSNVAEGYIESSIKNEQKISDKIFGQVADSSTIVMSQSSFSLHVSAGSSKQTPVQYEKDLSVTRQLPGALTQERLVNMTNCHNINLNINVNYHSN